MWRRKYKHAVPVITSPRTMIRTQSAPRGEMKRDFSRRHAFNWVMGVLGVGLSVIGLLWWLTWWRGISHWVVIGLFPVPFVGAIITGAVQLIRYTIKYRQWLYTQDDVKFSSPPEPDIVPFHFSVIHKAPGNVAEHTQVGILPVPRGVPLDEIFDTVACGAHRWSQRSLARVPGMSGSQAKLLLEAMFSAGFLMHREGKRNHPDGHILTPSGRAMHRRLSA